jgi:hypothetical protein
MNPRATRRLNKAADGIGGLPATRETMSKSRNPKVRPDTHSAEFDELISYLRTVPGIDRTIGSGWFENRRWWVKLSIDIDHPLAWHVVQHLGHVLNYMSLNDRLPTVFMPVSSPPYLNGGPGQFLAWVIESKVADYEPDICAKWLDARLPKPVDELASWSLDRRPGRK